MLEKKVGREKFDAFLRKYFDEHKFQSMTTEKFLAYLDENLIKPNSLDVDVNAWVYNPGLPAGFPKASAERFVNVDEQREAFLKGKNASTLVIKDWSTHEWLHFLKALPDSLTESQMKDLDKSFSFTKSQNSEIKAAWYRLAINQGYGKQ